MVLISKTLLQYNTELGLAENGADSNVCKLFNEVHGNYVLTKPNYDIIRAFTSHAKNINLTFDIYIYIFKYFLYTTYTYFRQIEVCYFLLNEDILDSTTNLKDILIRKT